MRNILAGLRILLGITFLFSAYTKFVDPGFFKITLMVRGLAHDRFFAAQLARFFIGLEFTLGILSSLPFYIKKLITASLLLLGGFTLHLFYLWSIGDTENCVCFGEMISMTPVESIIKNIVLVVISAFLFWKTPKDIRSIKPVFLITGIIIASMWLLLPLPNYSDYPFQKFTQFEYAGRVDLAAEEKPWQFLIWTENTVKKPQLNWPNWIAQAPNSRSYMFCFINRAALRLMNSWSLQRLLIQTLLSI